MVQTRATTKRSSESSQYRTPWSDSDSDEIDPVSPLAKKRRQRHTDPKKRQRGKQRELCRLNLDVLFLIATYIQPLDLLNLARTCKSLRGLLMDKSSTFVWKTARRQVEPAGLPDCPADLTEPEYAHLVFYTRCYGCGKYARKILWRIRRRYCPDCRDVRLRRLSLCSEVFRQDDVLPSENLCIEGEMTMASWVDQAQMQSFMQEYARYSDQDRFLHDKRLECAAILQHAAKCRRWELSAASKRRFNLDLRRHARHESIFERLEEHGYAHEIEYFGHYPIQRSHRAYFRTSKPLTDREWSQMWPEWQQTMSNFRSQRLEKVVYTPRRDTLGAEYNIYVLAPPPDTPAYDYLPDLTELYRFPPFQNVIEAPEGTEAEEKPFETAFTQLPALVEEWRTQIDGQLAQLVKIPAQLVSQDDGSRDQASGITEAHQTPADKLRLACAVFITGSTSLTHYPDVFPLMHRRFGFPRNRDQSNMSLCERFYVKFFEHAPYIVRACGLDPHVTTIDDMDSRNLRLKCLSCQDGLAVITNWRGAMWHTFSRHALAHVAQWQVIDESDMAEVQTASTEPAAANRVPLGRWTRCLLCIPRVGTAAPHYGTLHHLIHCHGIEGDGIKQGVHYVPLGIHDSCATTVLDELDAGGEVAILSPF